METKEPNAVEADKAAIDQLKFIAKGGKGVPVYQRLLITNAQMWLLEELITDKMFEKDYEEVGKLYIKLRELTTHRAQIKGESKTY